MVDPKHLSFREQLQGLLNDNIDKYPDAVRWLMEKVDAEPSIKVRKTEYERFVAKLSGKSDWQALLETAVRLYPSNNPSANQSFMNNYASHGSFKIERIKWIRSRTQLGLKEAKDVVEAYGENDHESLEIEVRRMGLENEEFDI